MLRRAAVDRGDLAAPPREFGACDAGIGALVDDVIDFAAEREERGDCAPAFGRQEQKAVVEARAALRGFLLAILVRRHRGHSVKMLGDATMLGRARKSGGLLLAILVGRHKRQDFRIEDRGLSGSGFSARIARVTTSAPSRASVARDGGETRRSRRRGSWSGCGRRRR